MIAAVVLVAVGAASATPWVLTLQLPTFGIVEPPTLDIPPITLPPQEPAGSDLPVSETLENILLVLAAAVAVGIVGYLLFRLIQRLRGAWRPEDETAGEQLAGGDALGEVVDIAALATAVARAEAHLAGLAEPGDAVTAAWVALEDEAALQGTSRDPSQTATEFTTELLRRTPAPADAVTLLRALYHKARFTAHPVTAADVHRAREALGRIAEALDAAAVAQRAEPS